MALDHPDRVAKLVVLDIVPTGAMWAGATRVFAVNTFHWGFLAQGGGMPERLIGADPDGWLEFVCRKWSRDFEKLADAMPEYARAFRKPEVIAASCADYRAGATLDDEQDRADLAAGRKIACPVLAIWSGTFVGQGKSADPLATWRQYAADVRGFPVACGHFIPEEAPEVIRGPIEELLSG
jgi:haloacetate dehalogenase